MSGLFPANSSQPTSKREKELLRSEVVVSEGGSFLVGDVARVSRPRPREWDRSHGEWLVPRGAPEQPVPERRERAANALEHRDSNGVVLRDQGDHQALRYKSETGAATGPVRRPPATPLGSGSSKRFGSSMLVATAPHREFSSSVSPPCWSLSIPDGGEEVF